MEGTSSDNTVDTSESDNLDLLRELLEDPSYLPGWNFTSKSEIAELKLLSMMQGIPNLPLDLYDKVVDWAKETYSHASTPGDCENLSLIHI